MRLDLFLKVSRLIPRRSLAQEFCDAGLIAVNGARAKSSKEVKAGDTIKIDRRTTSTTFRITDVPNKKQVTKNEAHHLIEIVSEESRSADSLA